VARRNPVLNDIIAGQLYAHTSQYLVDDSECIIKFASLFEFFPTKDKKVSLKVFFANTKLDFIIYI
jgi:hypothetical protein